MCQRHTTTSPSLDRHGCPRAWIAIVALFFPLIGPAIVARAATLYWDANGTTTIGTGGTPSGAWGAGHFHWNPDPSGGDGYGSPVDLTSTGDNLCFSAGTDGSGNPTITLVSNLGASSLACEEGTTYTIAGGTLTLGGDGEINCSANRILAVDSLLHVISNHGLVKNGLGQLNLNNCCNVFPESGAAVTVNAGGLSVHGSIDGGGSVTVDGSCSTLTLHVLNRYTGGTTLREGGRIFFNSGSLGEPHIFGDRDISCGDGGLYWIENNRDDISDRLNVVGTLQLHAQGNSISFSNDLTGGGTLVLADDPGSFTLNADNRALAGVVWQGGNLVIGHAGALGDEFHIATSSSGALDASQSGIVLSSNVTWCSADGPLPVFQGSHDLTVGGTVTLVAASTHDQGVNVAAGNLTLAGPIVADPGYTGGFVKSGAGTLTLAATCGYAGRSVVQDGILLLDESAHEVILAGGGADIQSGKIVFNYTGAAPDIGALLDASHGAGGTTAWTAGQFLSTNADANHGLGWIDNTSSKQVTVMVTLYGDSNCDGSVNGTDLNAVLSNYNQSSQIWANGDFNYDGSVNGTDLNTVLSSYNQSLPAVTAAVPEPPALLLAILGLAGLLVSYRVRV